MTKINIVDPEKIEEKSMEIIEKEIGKLNCSEEEKKVIKRVVHATADPDFVNLIQISHSALKSGLEALKKGVNIVTDVSMLKAGINKRKLASLGGKVNCYISDKDVAEKAKELGITRSMVSMRKAVEDKKNRILAIGNAPTALFEIIDLIKEGKVDFDLIVGTPVGFVGASESKEELAKLDIPHITVKGRKGGSPVAASIINALLYMIKD